MKRVLVTGGAGFIGSHVVDRLVGEGLGVRVLDNLSSAALDNLARYEGDPRVEVAVGDLKRVEDVVKAIEGAGAVFHYAANPGVRLSTTNPEIHFNENVGDLQPARSDEEGRRQGDGLRLVEQRLRGARRGTCRRGGSREAGVRLRGEQGRLRELNSRVLQALRNQSRGPEVRERRRP